MKNGIFFAVILVSMFSQANEVQKFCGYSVLKNEDKTQFKIDCNNNFKSESDEPMLEFKGLSNSKREWIEHFSKTAAAISPNKNLKPYLCLEAELNENPCATKNSVTLIKLKNITIANMSDSH